MPSAAMLDKSTQETTVPTQLCLQMIEKKTRNLEKRKGKLDNLRNDVTKGKELNEDQKQAVGKYEEVLSLLDFAKDMYKSMNAIFLESSRQTRRQAKKEQMERQQREIQRLQEALIYVHILSCFQNEDVRSDFLNGEHGAVQLSSEQLSQLDQLYKLIGPGGPADQADLVNHFHAMAENYIFLVEGRRKEIVSTTYKVLKDLLLSIKECGYFSRSSEQLDNGISSDELPEDENANKKQEVSEDLVLPAEATEVETVAGEAFVASEQPNVLSNGPADITAEMPHVTQSAPLQEVLATQGSFNFLQESQIDLDAPHMDPAVVAVHPMAPPTGNFALNSYTTASVEDPSPSLMNGTDPQVPVMAPVLASADFDPSHPIPTQTFTNQSFAVMQNMIMPQYVPVTMHHGPLPPHITPIAVVPGSPVASATAPVVPLQVPVVAVQENAVSAAVDSKAGVDKSRAYEGGKEASNAEPNSNDVSAEPANEGGNGYPHNRNNFRGGRGRGRGNGYFRGRGNFYNGRGGGGGYQDRSSGGYQDRNRFYQDRDRNGYNGNFRRDNNRGPRGNGNNRGRGNYNRPQGPEGNYNRPQAPPQQQQQPQQAQQ